MKRERGMIDSENPIIISAMSTAVSQTCPTWKIPSRFPCVMISAKRGTCISLEEIYGSLI
jgi:hypothetical protein